MPFSKFIPPLKLNEVYQSDYKVLSKQIIGKVDLVYADILYDEWYDVDFGLLASTLKPGGALWVQTDQRSVVQCKEALEHIRQFNEEKLLIIDKPYLNFINWIIWPYDWGGRARDAFGRKHDDILYYRKHGGKGVFNTKAIEIPKAVLINSDKKNKIPTDVWSDIGNFYTTSKERLKIGGKCIPWQKPIKLMERILLSCTNKNHLVFEPFLGTGTMCYTAKIHGRRFVGCDIRPKLVRIARRRINNAGKEKATTEKPRKGSGK